MLSEEGPAREGQLSAPAPLDYLKGLYTFVATLALQEAVQQIIATPPDVTFRWHAVPLIIAFLFTLVPFYHGALRHLEHLYGVEATQSQRRSVMMIDFSLLFIESGLLFALARLIASPHNFGWALLVLLATDVVWAVLVTRLTGEELLHESNWVKVNLVMLSLLLATVRFVHEPRALPVGPVVIAVTRTIVDYYRSWTY